MSGTTQRDSLRRIANRARAIPGAQFGLRPYTVSVTTISWTGDHPGEGTETVTTTAITELGQPPRVRQLSSEELALGSLPRGTVEVGPVTPDYAGGGTSWSTLTGGGVAAGAEFFFTLTGPEFPTGARFVLAGSTSDRALGYRVTLKPMSA